MVVSGFTRTTNCVVRLLGFCCRSSNAIGCCSAPHWNPTVQPLTLQKIQFMSGPLHRRFSTRVMATAAEAISNAEINSTTDQAAENVTSTPEGDTNKRPIEDNNEADAKKPKLESDAKNQNGGRPYKKKKVAMLMMYSGKGYQGMQMNPGAKAIEDDLMSALVKAGVVTEDHASAPGPKMSFQRAARTDKGVSAAGQVCSLKINVEKPVEKINSHLPDQIRVLGFIPTTKGFDAKNATSARTYMYILPTFAFCPFDQKITADFRAPDDIVKKVNEVLSLFKGTRNFHNFTSGKKASDPSARRYIMDFYCDEPYMQDGLELVVIKVKGQSFMLHQIRKMIGLTIAIVKGLTDTGLIDKSWGPKKYDIPKAPGLGLMLDKVHYDAYNKRYDSDGIHQAVSWEKYEAEIEEFKKKFIYSTITETEKNENSMLNWLSTLHLHHFGEIPEDSNSVYSSTPLGQAHQMVYEAQNPDKVKGKSTQSSKDEKDVKTKNDAPVDSTTEDAKS